MRMIVISLCLLGSCPALARSADTGSRPVQPAPKADHAAMLASRDVRLARNKRLVYDMYRIVLQAGHADRAGEFISTDYIQHNPNAAQGLAGIVDYVRTTRPQRPITPSLELPLVRIVAEGDYVTMAFARPEKDSAGASYVTTWFDLFRIDHGKIVEHWDPSLKGERKIDPNEKRM